MHNWLRFEPLKPDLSCYISLSFLIAVCESQHLRSAPFTASDIPHISASSISLFLPRLVFCVCPSLSLSLPCRCCSVSPLVQLRSVTPEGQIGQVLFSHLNNSTSFFHKTFSRGDRETCNGIAFFTPQIAAKFFLDFPVLHLVAPGLTKNKIPRRRAFSSRNSRANIDHGVRWWSRYSGQKFGGK